MTEKLAKQKDISTIIQRIGWIWIILGILILGLGLIFTVMTFVTVYLIYTQSSSPLDLRLIPLPLLVPSLSLMLIGGGAIYSAANFLRLKASARTLLEIVNWIVLIVTAIVAFFGLAPLMWSGNSPAWFGIVQCLIFLVFGAFWLAILGGMGLMLIHLRGPAVREAMLPKSA